jgi:hypothetical protein
MVYVKSLNEYGEIVYENGRKAKEGITLIAENNSEYFYQRVEMLVTARDFYNSVPIKVFKPETGSTSGERNEFLIVIDKREIEYENLSEKAMDGYYLLVIEGIYVTTDTSPSNIKDGEVEMKIIKVEKFSDEIRITDVFNL